MGGAIYFMDPDSELSKMPRQDDGVTETSVPEQGMYIVEGLDGIDFLCFLR